MITQRRAVAFWLLLIGSLASLTLITEAKQSSQSWSKWRRPPPPPPEPGQHMFKEGRDVLEWDSIELTRIRGLETVGLDNQKEYMASSNLARFLGLSQVQTLHMPVPLSIVFVGFQGDGNLRVDIKDTDLVDWFANIDHDLPHIRVALSELSCSEDGHCAAQMEAAVPPSPLPAHVHLNFSCNVVVVKPGKVLEAFERAISAFSRPTDPAAVTNDQQVDAMKMESFVDGFLNSLGLQNTYTLLVLNPKWSASMPAYGYRMGFSELEVNLLAQQLQQLRQLAQGGWDPEPLPPGADPEGGFRTTMHSAGRRVHKFRVSDYSQLSDTWATAALKYLEQMEDHTRKQMKVLGPRSQGALAVARAVSLLTKQKRSELGSLLAASLSLPPEHLHNTKFRASHPLEDCITPVWVGHGRWAMVDLTARRTDWGPALGGDGIVTHLTLPDVHHSFAEAAEQKRISAAAKTPAEQDEKMRVELQTLKSERMAKLQHAVHHADQMHASRVHGVNPGEDVDPDGNPVGGPSDEHNHRDWQETAVHAEMNVYEEFASRYCKGVVNAPIVCMEIRDMYDELSHELQALARGSDAKYYVHRSHALDLFGDQKDIDEDPLVADVHARAKDVFLSELSNAMARALRHVIAPPTATWHHKGYLHDTASPYTHAVHFTLYMVADNSRKLGQWRQRGVNFDTEKFKQQVLRLQLPHQKFSFSSQELNLLDDPVLAAAFSTSLRTSFLEIPHAVTEPIQYEQLYLDSTELVYRLRQHFDGTLKRAAANDPHALLEVPVFVFQLDRDVPVLIDEHYNARAMEDMIVVVQNAANQDEHPTGMMCDAILLARPLSPLKHALGAVLQYLGGVLPPHLGYNPSRKLVTHDWLWSVGAHPLSWTAGGTSFAQVQIDALHRSYLLDALDLSIEMANAGIKELQEELPSEAAHKHLLKGGQGQVRKMLGLYSQLVTSWHQMVIMASELNFGQAAEVITVTESLSTAFLSACHELKVYLHPHKCSQRVPQLPRQLIMAMLVTGALAGLALLVVVIVPKFQKKAHQS